MLKNHSLSLNENPPQYVCYGKPLKKNGGTASHCMIVKEVENIVVDL